MLPRPLSLVEHFNRHEGNLANSDLDWLLRLADYDGSLLLPLGSLLTECTSVELVFIVSRHSLSLRVEPAHESPGDHINHVISELVESASPSGTSASSSAASAESPVVMTVASFVVRFLCLDLLILRMLSDFVFINCSNHDCGCILGLGDLEEGVLVRLSFLAGLTVVEVLADRALVPDTYNWVQAATVTGYVVGLQCKFLVNNALRAVRVRHPEISTLGKFLENLRG
jgi:hypothetical protein